MDEISAQSKTETGTSFKVTVPIDEKSYSSSEIRLVQKIRQLKNAVKLKETTPVETNSDLVDSHLDRPLILVVEDNIDLGHYIGGHLPDCGIILAAMERMA